MGGPAQAVVKQRQTARATDRVITVLIVILIRSFFPFVGFSEPYDAKSSHNTFGTPPHHRGISPIRIASRPRSRVAFIARDK
jgi:hypothetical protein